MKKCTLFLLFYILVISPVFCSGDAIAKIIPEKGVCIILGKPDIEVLKPTDIMNNTRVKTGDGVKAKVIYNDGTEIKISGNSEIKFKKNMIRMKKGNSKYSFKKQGKQFKVITPTMLMGVFGTTFSVSVPETSRSSVSLLEGSIEAKALFGNKKSVMLKPGQMVNADKNGLSNVSLISKKIMQYGGGIDKSGADSSGTSDEGDEFEVAEEIEDQDLEMCGDITYFIYPIPDSSVFNEVYLPFRLLIDGYATLNGKKIMSSKTGKLMVKGLESGSYEFTILISGTSYSFFADISKDNSGFCKKIKYHRMKINMFIENTQGNGKYKEVMNNMDIHFTCNGIRNKVQVAGYENLEEIGENAVHIYRAKDGKDAINLCFPSELTDTAILEFNYHGELPLKTKKIKLIVDSSTDEYDVRF